MGSMLFTVFEGFVRKSWVAWRRDAFTGTRTFVQSPPPPVLPKGCVGRGALTGTRAFV